MNHYRPADPIRPAAPAKATSSAPADAVARAECQLAELREARAAMRAEWDALMADLGDPRLPTDAELERMMNALPPTERQALRRYHAETQALGATFRGDAAQPRAARVDNLPILHHFIRG